MKQSRWGMSMFDHHLCLLKRGKKNHFPPKWSDKIELVPVIDYYNSYSRISEVCDFIGN